MTPARVLRTQLPEKPKNFQNAKALPHLRISLPSPEAPTITVLGLLILERIEIFLLDSKVGDRSKYLT